MVTQEIGLNAVLKTAEFSKGLDTYLNGIRQATDATEQSGKTITGSGRAAGQSMNLLGSVMTGVATGGTFALISAVGTGLSNAFSSVTGVISQARDAIVSFGQESLFAAGRTDGFNRVALLLGQRAGYTGDQVQGFVDQVTEAGIRADVSNNLIANFARRQLDLAQATELAALAQNAAFLASTDSSTALDTLNTIVGTGNRLMARNIGLEVDFIGAQDELAMSLGTTREALTANQRAQANLNALLAEGQSIMGVYGAAMGSPVKNLGSLERQVFNLRAALGAPFLDAWNNVIQAARELVSVFTTMVSEGGSLYPVIVNIGAALSLLTEWLADVVVRGANLINEFADNWIGGLANTADSSLQWGAEIVAALAEGIVSAAASVLVAAMNFVGSILSFWLAPGSPPRVAPDLPEWGAEAMNEYLEGFTQADFGILGTLQGVLKKQLADQDFADVSQLIAEALTQGADETFFQTLARAAGQFGDQISRLARLQFELADATNEVAAANKEFETAQSNVASLVAEYNDLLREGASDELLAAQLARINAAEEERDAAAERARTAGDNIDQLEEEASLQEQLVRQLQQLSDAQEQAADAAARGGAGGAGGRAGGGAGRGRAGVGALGGLAGLGAGLPDIDPSGITTRISAAIEEARNLILQRLGTAFEPLREAWNNSISGTLGELASRFSKFRQIVIDSFGTLRDGGPPIVQAGLQVIEGLWLKHGASIRTIVSTLSDGLATAYVERLAIIGQIVNTGLEIVRGWWDLNRERIVEIVSLVGRTVITIFRVMFTNISNLFSTFASALQGNWRSFGENLRNIWDASLNALVTIFTDVKNTLLGVAQSAADDLVAIFRSIDLSEIGSGIVSGLANGITQGIQSAISAARGAGQAIDGAMRGFFEQRSPSKLMERRGEGVMQGLGIGMANMIPMLTTQAQLVAQSVERAMAATNPVINVTVPAQGTSQVSNNTRVMNDNSTFNVNNFSPVNNQAQFNQMADMWFRTRMVAAS